MMQNPRNSLVKYESLGFDFLKDDKKRSEWKAESLADTLPIPQAELKELLIKMQGNSEDNEALLQVLDKEKLPFLFTSDDLASLIVSTESIKTKIAIIEMIAFRLIDPTSKLQYFRNCFKYAEEKEHVEKALKERMIVLQNSMFIKTDIMVGRYQPVRLPGGGGRGAGKGAGRGAGFRSQSMMIPSSPEANLRNSAWEKPPSPGTPGHGVKKSASEGDATTMDDRPIILEKLEITSRAVKSRTQSADITVAVDNASPRQQAQHLHQGTSEVGMKKLRDRLNAFNEAGKSNVKKTVDLTQLGQRRVSSVKDVVDLINREKKIMSVEQQYNISANSMTEEERDYHSRVKEQQDTQAAVVAAEAVAIAEAEAARARSRSSHCENVVTIKRSEGDITVTLDNDDDGSDDGDDQVESTRPFAAVRKYAIDESLSSSDLLFGSTGESTFLDDEQELQDKEDTLKQSVTTEETHAELVDGSNGTTPTNGHISSSDSNSDSNSSSSGSKCSTISDTHVSSSSSAKVVVTGDLKRYLLKRSPNFLVGWQIRYFTLSETGDLFYYKKEDSLKAQGLIQRKNVLKKYRIDFDKSTLRFEIATKGRVYYVMASTEHDAFVWTETLNQRFKIP